MFCNFLFRGAQSNSLDVQIPEQTNNINLNLSTSTLPGTRLTQLGQDPFFWQNENISSDHENKTGSERILAFFIKCNDTATKNVKVESSNIVLTIKRICNDLLEQNKIVLIWH